MKSQTKNKLSKRYPSKPMMSKKVEPASMDKGMKEGKNC